MHKIIYEDNHLLVVVKPFNMPCQQDNSNDLDLLTYYKKYLKEKYHKPNNVFLSLVHRLDRPTGGICVLCKTSKAASRLSKQIREHNFHKEYIAVVNDYNLKQHDTYEDYLQKNTKTNIVEVNKLGKYCKLSYMILEKYDNYARILVSLITGRSHQIRVQMSSRGQYLYGDHKYNPNVIKGSQLALWSYSINFKHPTTKEQLKLISDVPNIYPFRRNNE